MILAAPLLDTVRASIGAIEVQVEAQCVFAFSSKEVISLRRVELPTPDVAMKQFEAVDYGDRAVTISVRVTAHGRIQIHCAVGI
ncbi:hypothetical protein LFL97_32820 [Burkholderia sp. JSH-S8]|nr:hypothetical protein LFL97_19945 [Burkholderia sp. JSH-S8]WGS46957.1 hypothetical protein LFL97_32820 [Burkholderia sp. JSH-S8]